MPRTKNVLLTLLLAACPALADSDGYYCIGDGYLAYELRELASTQPTHTLRIVAVGGPDGIAKPATLALEDFQVHGMKCRRDDVILLGSDKSYTVDVSDPGRPRLVAVTALAAGGPVPPGYFAESLSYVRRSSVTRIPSPRKDRTYELEITHREKRIEDSSGHAFEHETTSALVEKDSRGGVLRREPLHRGVSEETID